MQTTSEMQTSSLTALEWPHLLDHLARHAVTRRGQALCRAIPMATDLDSAWHLQLETAEARRLIEADGKIPLGGIMDIANHVHRALRGAMLEPAALLEIGSTVRAARVLRQYAQARAEQAPLFWEIVAPLPVPPGLEAAIDQTFRQDGSIHDNATSDLATIRSDMRDTQTRIRGKLHRILQSGQYKNVIQESVITQRDGRYVLPVKVEGQSSLRGIIHDQSASGATVYLEPMAVVEDNNKLRRLEASERAEIDRILAMLSGQVARMADPLLAMTELQARVDLIVARAGYAIALKAEIPRLVDKGYLSLKKARHPLLIGRLGFDKVVPLDVEIAFGHTLIVTGPNTGGKTVALKTLGLLSLMARTGMQVPAMPETQIPIFGAVLADIGDEQSLEQSLSTFSGHMHHLVAILEQADTETLILLDEIGTGTDPAEGAALAQAIIETLRDRRVTTMITTHYGSLKAMAYHQDGIQNAATEFDDETLAPTYRLLMGQPGRSNALAITRRLGLADSIIGRATELLGMERQDLETVIGELSRERYAVEIERKALADAQKTADSELSVVMELRQQLDEEREAWRDKSQRQLDDDIAAARQEVSALVRNLQQSGTAQQAQRVKDSLDDISRKLSPGKRSGSTRAWAIGDQVIVSRLGTSGKVSATADSSGNVQVQLGSIKMMVASQDLKPVVGAVSAGKPKRSHVVTVQGGKSTASVTRPDTGWELDLRGRMAQEALAELDQFLDQAFSSNHRTIYIIHGKGTGALRAAVQEYLKDSPYVDRFRGGTLPEGGAGVTVAELA